MEGVFRALTVTRGASRLASMDYAEDKKNDTNQTGCKDPATDDLFKHVYFRTSVFFVGHGDTLSLIRISTWWL
jgi:hypothetical protein